MYEDQPGQVAQEAATAVALPDQRAGTAADRARARASARMKRRDLLNYRRKFYHSGNLFITVAGKTDLAEVRELLKPLLRNFPAGNRSPYTPVSGRQTAPRFQLIRKPIEQTHFVLALRGVSLHDPRRSAFRLMSVILGENMSSRLFQVVREEHGLAYSHQHRRELLPGNGQLLHQRRRGEFQGGAGHPADAPDRAQAGAPRAEREGIAPRQGIHLRPDSPRPGKHRQPDDVDGRGPHRPRPRHQSRRS